MPSTTFLRMLTHTVDDVTYLRFHGTQLVLDEENAQWLRERLSKLVQEGRRTIIVDLGAIHYITSTGVETFLAIHRQLKAEGGRLRLHHLTPPVAEIFAILKLNDVLDLDGDDDGEADLSSWQ
jgi:anti-anti-sigma factor